MTGLQKYTSRMMRALSSKTALGRPGDGPRLEETAEFASLKSSAGQLFSEGFYLAQLANPDEARTDSFLHYLKRGWLEGLDPSPRFSTNDYVQDHPDVAKAGMNPLIHYLKSGRDEERAVRFSRLNEANPLVLSDEPELAALIRYDIDRAYYFEQVNDLQRLGVDPAVHYVRLGWRLGIDPCANFSNDGYLADHLDVAAADIPPFCHYTSVGRQEGRAVRLSAGIGTSKRFAALSDDEARWLAARLSPHFSTSFYLKQYSDVADADVDPLWHYTVVGWREKRDPNPHFSVELFLEQHPSFVGDDGTLPTPPLLSAVEEGAHREGFAPYRAHRFDDPPDDTTMAFTPNPETIETEAAEDAGQPVQIPASVRQLLESAFDEAFYIKRNPDLIDADVEPLDHFLTSGWKEGRDPSPSFSTAYYLSRNPDVASSGANPFLHFLESGEAEGRFARHPAGQVADILEDLKTPDEKAREWMSERQVEPGDADQLHTLFRQSSNQHLVVSVSHDLYHENVGGIQLCIQIEQNAFNDTNTDYLHLAPFQPLPMVTIDDLDNEHFCDVSFNGTLVNTFQFGDILAFIDQATSEDGQVSIVVHSLLGHSVDLVGRLLSKADPKERWLWVHDYSLTCPGYNLLRNDLDYCHAPDATSASCRICVYGDKRRQVKPHLDRLLEDVSPQLVAPSIAAADEIRRALHPLTPTLTVHEHGALIEQDTPHLASEPASENEAKPFRIAFLGYPTIPKGWQQFAGLAEALRDDERYAFYCFGSQPIDVPGITHVPVTVTSDQPNAMIDALDDHEIDAAAILSLWPETFCFTAYEAVSAGCMLIASSNSGNVAHLAQERGGVVVADGLELTAMFEGDEIAHRLAERRASGRQHFTIERSFITRDLIDHDVAAPAAEAQS
ncbi:MAG: hypothetical protein AAF511_03640 [Pseudomonadota bacterium]